MQETTSKTIIITIKMSQLLDGLIAFYPVPQNQ